MENHGIFRIFLGKLFHGVVIVGFLKKIVLFSVGGLGYVGLELLWRGRSHSSMFLAGGTCFLILGALPREKLSPLRRAIFGGGLITCVELLTGLLFNRDYRVWDYRKMALNFHGQICAGFLLLWMPLSLLGGSLYRVCDRLLNRLQLGKC